MRGVVDVRLSRHILVQGPIQGKCQWERIVSGTTCAHSVVPGMLSEGAKGEPGNTPLSQSWMPLLRNILRPTHCKLE